MHTKLSKFSPINILGNLSPAEAVRNLGVWFILEFPFSCHVKNTYKACSVHIRDLKSLRGYLAHKAALLAANASVGSNLDYCNSLFSNLSALDLCMIRVFKTVLLEIMLIPPGTPISLV